MNRTLGGVRTVGDRRYFDYISEVQVGTSRSSFNYVTASSGLGPLSFKRSNPWVMLPIPLGTPVTQFLNSPFVEAELSIRDLEAVTQLFKTVDVDGDTDGVQAAMSSTNRTVIGWLCVIAYQSEVDNTTDARQAKTVRFIFNNPRIRFDDWSLDNFADPVKVLWYADSLIPEPVLPWWILTVEDVAIATRESQVFTVSTVEDVTIATRESQVFTVSAVEDASIATRESQVFSISTVEEVTVS